MSNELAGTNSKLEIPARSAGNAVSRARDLKFENGNSKSRLGRHGPLRTGLETRPWFRISSFGFRTSVLLLSLALAGVGHAQGVRYDNIALSARGLPIAGVSVAVCTIAASTSATPCSPLASIYSDRGLTQPLANPTSSSGLGNYGFFAAPGSYLVQIYGPMISTPQVYTVTLPCDPSSSAPCSTTAGFSTSGAISAGTLSITGNISATGTISSSAGTAPGISGAITAGDCAKWASASSIQDAGGPCGNANAASDAVMYVSPNGNDSANGLSWATAKQTIYSAWSTLVTNTAGNLNAGGTIFVTNNAACGGPTTGQGLQIMGSGDVNYLAFSANNSILITAMSRTSNVVTVTLNAAPPSLYTVGATILVSGASDSSFNGTFTVASVGTSSFTYSQTGANSSVTAATIIPNGWLKAVQARIVGVGTNSWGFNGHAPQAQLNCGSSTQPPLWVSGVNSPLSFENLRFFGGPQALRLGVCSNSSTSTGSCGVSSAQFKNLSSTTYASSGGPTVEIATNSFWLFFDDDQFELSGNTCTTGADSCEAVVIDPAGAGTGSGLIYFHDVNLVSGGMKFYPGGNGGSLFVDDMTTENQQDGKGAVWFTSTNSYTSAVINNVSVADATVNPTPAVEVDSGPPDAVLVTGAGGYGKNVIGPAIVLSQYPNNLQGFTANPITTHQIDYLGGKSFFQNDAGRRMFSPVASRFTNLASQLPSTWAASPGITVTSVAAPDGTNNAGHGVNTATSSGNMIPFNGNITFAAGDYLIGGVWVRAPGGWGGGINVNFGPTCSISTTGLTPYSGPYGVLPSPFITGDGEWEWFSGAYKVNAAATNCYSPFTIGVPASNGVTEAYAPVLYHVAAGTISDTEAAYIALHLASYPDSLAPPVEATLRGHPFAFGGSGDAFFATLDHTALTANQTYTLPNASGNIVLDSATQTLTNKTLTSPAVGTHLNQAAAGQWAGTVTLSSGAGTFTFPTAYTSAPVCVATDTTAAAAVKASATTTTLTLAGTGTDAIAFVCVGNPN